MLNLIRKIIESYRKSIQFNTLFVTHSHSCNSFHVEYIQLRLHFSGVCWHHSISHFCSFSFEACAVNGRISVKFDSIINNHRFFAGSHLIPFIIRAIKRFDMLGADFVQFHSHSLIHYTRREHPREENIRNKQITFVITSEQSEPPISFTYHSFRWMWMFIL